jgi:hypothetical protein
MILDSVQIAESDDITKKKNKNMSVKIITNHQKLGAERLLKML